MRNVLQAKSQTEHLKTILEKEKRNGHMTFRTNIAEALHDEYEVPLKLAMKYVNKKEVQDRIQKDMAWAQHMGADFWATEIYEIYIENDLVNS